MRWSRCAALCAITALVPRSCAVGVPAKRLAAEDGPAVTSTSASQTATESESTTVTEATSTTASSAAETDTPSSTTASSSVVLPSSTDFPVCHADNSKLKPFCLPENGTEVYVGDSYYVTWDSDMYPINSSISIGLNYVNTTANAGKSAFTSDKTANSYGFLTITMDKAWLQEESRNNLTLYIVEYDPSSDHRAQPVTGPTISLVQKPVKHLPPSPQTPNPTKLGLAIGLPLGLGAIFLISLGLCIGMRKHRRIGLGSVMGKGNGYGGRKSRRQRMGGRRDDIRLGDLDDPDRYTDEPHHPTQVKYDTETYNDMQRTRGNVFRDEISRLKTWR